MGIIDKTMNSRIQLLLPAVILLFSHANLYSNPVYTINESLDHCGVRESSVDSLPNIQNDIEIIIGDHVAYRKLHNEYTALLLDGKLPNEKQRIWLLDAYIMAENFQDTIAAYDFIKLIESSSIAIDSSVSVIIIKYLEMLSKSSPGFLSLYGAQKLSEIYMYGQYGVIRNQSKSNYYKQKVDEIGLKMRGK